MYFDFYNIMKNIKLIIILDIYPRLLPFTKEMPKEMMPIFSQTFTKNRVVLPLLQYIYEQLYSMNFRDYCFIVGREKRTIEDQVP